METHEGASKRKRKPAKADRPEVGKPRKVAILFDPDVDLRLTILAAKRAVGRSQLVNDLVDRETRGIVVSFRGPSAEGAAGGDEAAA